MKANDLMLVAYVDGEPSRNESREVEDHIRASVEAAELVALLRASRADYKRAHATQKLPPVPDSLIQKIEAMAHAHSARSAVTWRQDELGYALIGKTAGVDPDALGKRISSDEVKQLFSKASSALLPLAA
jgi:hypothetical protein